MKSKTKSSITLPPEALRMVVALQALREAYRRASRATRASLAHELSDLDPLTADGLDEA